MQNDTIQRLLDRLNQGYAKVHKQYEQNFWLSRMGDHGFDNKMTAGMNALDSFRSDRTLADQVEKALEQAVPEERERLLSWKSFFSKYQSPKRLLPLKKRISKLEAVVQGKLDSRKEGYVDPKTKKFISASTNQMRTMMRTHDDEQIRKACFYAIEKISLSCVNEFVQLVRMRNQYARSLGFRDFYEYRSHVVEGMTKKEIFQMFDTVYRKMRPVFRKIRQKEKKMSGLRRPWNFDYFLSSDFTKEEDQYFNFQEALILWGRSFSALGIGLGGGVLQLDLLDRKGKHNNGFCHYPSPVRYKNGKRMSGTANISCNLVLGQVGEGSSSMRTLFHEGGHAADRLNSAMPDICLNNEYPPASVAWAETHSQFLDTIFSSVDWRTRYTRNKNGVHYPFELYERKLRRLHWLAPLGIRGIMFVSEFERRIYEARSVKRDLVIRIARATYRKFFNFEVDSNLALYIPHIYYWDNSVYYHGYGLAELALAQWREYFYEKYGYVVDNQRVGEEMISTWRLGSAKTFKEFVVMATGKPLSADAFIRSATRSVPATLALAKKRIARLKRVPLFKKRIDLNATIRMVHGKQVICTNRKSFEDMAEKYAAWLKKMERVQLKKG